MNTKRFLHYFLSMTMIASLLFVASCGTEDDPLPDFEAPGLLIEGEDADATSFNVGDTIDLEFSFTTPEGLSSFNIIRAIDGTPVDTAYVNPTDIGFQGNETEGTINSSSFPPSFFKIPEGWAGQDVALTFQVVDMEDQSAEADYAFTVNDPAFLEYETVLLGGQGNKTEPSFYNAIEDERYDYSTAVDSADLVDFLYYYVDETSSGSNIPYNTIAAPANTAARATFEAAGLPLPAEMDNATQFKGLPVATTYDDITTNDDLINAFVENPETAGTRIPNLEEGQVFAFMLDESRGGRYGVARVAEIAEATGGADRTITLDVKVQEADNE